MHASDKFFFSASLCVQLKSLVTSIVEKLFRTRVMEIFIYAILVSIAYYGWFFIYFFESLCQDNVLRHSDLTAELCFKRYLKLNVLIYMLSFYLFYDNLGLLYSILVSHFS